jgi:hypothetical protein
MFKLPYGFWCSIIGHKWVNDGHYKKKCKRKNCLNTKTLMWNRSDPFKPALNWKENNFNEISKINFK